MVRGIKPGALAVAVLVDGHACPGNMSRQCHIDHGSRPRTIKQTLTLRNGACVHGPHVPYNCSGRPYLA